MASPATPWRAGLIDTDLGSDVLDPAFREQVKERTLQSLPLGRLGTAEDVARGILFLVSDDAGYITGHVLDINGGALMDSPRPTLKRRAHTTKPPGGG